MSAETSHLFSTSQNDEGLALLSGVMANHLAMITITFRKEETLALYECRPATSLSLFEQDRAMRLFEIVANAFGL